MSVYVGIDASLQSTGVAVLEDGKPPRVLTIKSKPAASPTIESRARRATDATLEMLAFVMRDHGSEGPLIEQPDGGVSGYHVAIEAPIFSSVRGVNGHLWDRSHQWWSLVTPFLGVNPVSEINVKTLKKFATGDGGADKPAMGHKLGGEVLAIDGKINDDTIDAMWLALMAQAHYAPDLVPITLHKYRLEALKAVAW